jgi:hypothetical protein
VAQLCSFQGVILTPLPIRNGKTLRDIPSALIRGHFARIGRLGGNRSICPAREIRGCSPLSLSLCRISIEPTGLMDFLRCPEHIFGLAVDRCIGNCTASDFSHRNVGELLLKLSDLILDLSIYLLAHLRGLLLLRELCGNLRLLLRQCKLLLHGCELRVFGEVELGILLAVFLTIRDVEFLLSRLLALADLLYLLLVSKPMRLIQEIKDASRIGLEKICELESLIDVLRLDSGLDHVLIGRELSLKLLHIPIILGKVLLQMRVEFLRNRRKNRIPCRIVIALGLRLSILLAPVRWGGILLSILLAVTVIRLVFAGKPCRLNTLNFSRAYSGGKVCGTTALRAIDKGYVSVSGIDLLPCTVTHLKFLPSRTP